MLFGVCCCCCCCFGPSFMGNRISLDCFCCFCFVWVWVFFVCLFVLSFTVLIGGPRLQDSLTLLLRCVEGRKKTHETHNCVVPQVLTTLNSLISFQFSESSYACLLGYIQGLLLLLFGRGRSWEEYSYSILVGTRTLKLLFVKICNDVENA